MSVLLRRWISSSHLKFNDIWPKIKQVEGYLASGQEKWLFETARSLRDGARIVEIGSFKGRSTVCLGYGCVGTRRHVFAIDRFKGVYQDIVGQEQLERVFTEGFFDEWEANINRNGLLDYVTPLVGDSHAIAQVWAAPIDLLFIDGSHQFEDTVSDFEDFYPYVSPNGIIALHDVTPEWEGTYKAWNDHIKARLHDHGAVSSLAYGRK